PVVAGVVDVVGLGGGKENAVYPAREGAQQRIGFALAETGQYGAEGRFEIAHRSGPGIERAQRVDKHDLPIQPREVVAEEGADDPILVGLVTLLQHAVETVAANIAGGQGERGKGQGRRALEVSW